jgi:hypothetical protein
VASLGTASAGGREVGIAAVGTALELSGAGSRPVRSRSDFGLARPLGAARLTISAVLTVLRVRSCLDVGGIGISILETEAEVGRGTAPADSEIRRLDTGACAILFGVGAGRVDWSLAGPASAVDLAGVMCRRGLDSGRRGLERPDRSVADRPGVMWRRGLDSARLGPDVATRSTSRMRCLSRESA